MLIASEKEFKALYKKVSEAAKRKCSYDDFIEPMRSLLIPCLAGNILFGYLADIIYGFYSSPELMQRLKEPCKKEEMKRIITENFSPETFIERRLAYNA